MPRLGALFALLGPAGAAAAALHASSPFEGLGRTIGRKLDSSSPYVYLGCYADQGWNGQVDRALEHGQQFSGSMDHELCAKICDEEGYHYMGLQYGEECWCGTLGEEEKHTQYGPGTCNMPCAGDSFEICGGFWAFDLYFIGEDRPTPAPALATAQAPDGDTSSHEYMGCYADEGDHRALDPGLSHQQMTIERCEVHCASEGYHYMGLQYGQECWCGSSGNEEQHTQHGAGLCEMPCAGDSSEICGGFWAFDLYLIGEDDDSNAPATTPAPADDTPAPVTTPAPTTKPPLTAAPTTAAPTSATPTTAAPAAPSQGSWIPITPWVPVTPATPPTVATTAAERSSGDDPCDPNPCLNEGSCAEDSAGLYTCSCEAGYAGPTCETDTSGYPEFSIVVDFEGSWTEDRKNVFESAASRWAEVITHIPCTGTSALGDGAGVLRITATLDLIDGVDGILGYAGPSGIWKKCEGISYAGSMTFDLYDVSGLEEVDTFYGVVLHEMGHVIGVGTLWGDCSDCDESGSGEWTCPLGAEVYNNLAGNEAGSAADIVETAGAEGTRCSHFDDAMFYDELMTGTINVGDMPLSKLTAATLADRGYSVNMAMAEDFILPSKRPAYVMADPNTIEINDEKVASTIDISDEYGHVVGTIQGHRFRF